MYTSSSSSSSLSSSSSTVSTASLSIANVLPPFWRDIIKGYLRDDAPTFDIGGYVVGNNPETAKLLCKTSSKLAGVPFFNAVFDELQCTIEWNYQEGDYVTAPAVVAIVKGPVRNLLLGERTALNILTRATGIATMADELVKIAKNQFQWHGEVAGTRKVTPGFRLIEKYALLVGGASTHRMDLSHMVMLKDNHVWAAGSITKAIQAAKSVGGFSSKIEVEVRNLDEAKEAGKAGCDIIMLDNYPTAQALIEDAKQIKELFPHIIIEASGGINKDTLGSFCSPYVDVVSLGALTHGYSVADYSLKIDKGHGSLSIDKVIHKKE